MGIGAACFCSRAGKPSSEGTFTGGAGRLILQPT